MVKEVYNEKMHVLYKLLPSCNKICFGSQAKKNKKTKKQKKKLSKKELSSKIHGKSSDSNIFLLLFFFRRFNIHGLSCENSQSHQIKEEKQKEE